MSSADDFTDPPAPPASVVLERRAPVHERIAAIGGRELPLDFLRTVARDADSPGVVRAAAIVALAARDAPLEVDAAGDPAVAAAVSRVRVQARARDAVEATARGERVELPSAAALELPARAEPIERLRLDGEQARRAIESVRPELRAAAPAVSPALRCGERDIAVVTAGERLSVEGLLRRPAHVGSIVVHHTVEVDRWTAPFEVLTQPQDGGVTVSIVDWRGEVRYAGRGEPSGDHLAVRLHAADRPGAVPVEVIARVGEDGVELEGVTATGAVRQLSPAPDLEIRR